MAIEARVGADGQLAAGARLSDPADRLGQEVGGAPGGIGPTLAQPGHQHVAGPGGDRQERVIAPYVGVRVVPGTLLGQAVCLADGRVEIDRQGSRAGTGTGRPGPGEQLPADPVELADVAPAEAAQEGAQGRGGLQADAQHALRAAGPQCVRVVDAVAPGERREDEGQELVADVRPTRPGTEVEVLVHQLAETEMMGQGGRQQEPRVGHQAVVVERRVKPVEAVR